MESKLAGPSELWHAEPRRLVETVAVVGVVGGQQHPVTLLMLPRLARENASRLVDNESSSPKKVLSL